MRSITVGLCGGIGNQLFQYAMGLAMALRSNASLKLDIGCFKIDRYYQRTYALDRFNIRFNNEIVSTPTVFRIAQRLQYLPRFREPMQSLFSRWFIIEKSAVFDEYFARLKIDRPVYLMGFWQDERYFSDIKDTIINEFKLLNGFSEKNAIVAQHIQKTDSVAIHVRRLLQVQTSDAACPQEDGEEKGILLKADYYERALNIISPRGNDLQYFIFSDYPDWARTHLDLPSSAVFLYNDRGSDIEDMALMAMCKHHIIANSSFSWWGAYLGGSEKQVVVAPSGVTYTPNIPERWIAI